MGWDSDLPSSSASNRSKISLHSSTCAGVSFSAMLLDHPSYSTLLSLHLQPQPLPLAVDGCYDEFSLILTRFRQVRRVNSKFRSGTGNGRTSFPWSSENNETMTYHRCTALNQSSGGTPVISKATSHPPLERSNVGAVQRQAMLPP
jgi:hypothetical protein